MLVHCLRRWPNFKPALGQRLLFTGWFLRLTKMGNACVSVFNHVLEKEKNRPDIIFVPSCLPNMRCLMELTCSQVEKKQTGK